MSHSKHKSQSCTNCGYTFSGVDNYCPNCGQKNEEVVIPLKHHILELFEGLFHLDSKIYRTIKTLVLHPGTLSVDFNRGKRVSSVPPLRLYIFVSFVFFFLLSMKSFNSEENKEFNFAIKFATAEDRLSENERLTLPSQKLDSLSKFRTEINIKELRGLSDAQVESLKKEKGLSDNWLNRYIVHKLTQVARGEEEKFWHSILKNISYSMFLLMPLFGFFIMILNRKQTKYFVEGLVISIHYHIFIFLLLSVVLLIGKFTSLGMLIVVPLSLIVIPVYLFLMLKKYYKQKVFLTLFKTMTLGIIQILSVLIFYVGSIIITMVLL